MTCLYYLAAWLLVALITGAGLCRGIHQRKITSGETWLA